MKPLPSRREFIRTAAATIATALLPGRDNRAQTPPPPLKKGIMYGTVGLKGTVAEKLRAIRDAGFDGVEMMSHMDQDEVLRARDAAGLEIPSVCGALHWSKPLTHPDPKIRAEGLDALKQTLRDAKRYGASSVLLVPGVVNQEVSYDAAWDRSREEILKALPLAEELGVVIAIENVWNHFLLSPLEAARYVDSFESRSVGWHFDVGNEVTFGWPEQWIRILGKRIQKLHIKEYSRSKRDHAGPYAGFDVEFLKGDNNWPAVMTAVKEIGYHGWGIAEQGGAGSLDGMRKLAAEMDRIFAS